MNTDEDFIFALKLQKQFEREIDINEVTHNHPTLKKIQSMPGNENSKSVNKENCIVDPSWEYIDPTPDVHALFIQFDRRFFWGTLKHVEVRWSPKMTTCAGVCCYEGRGGLCSIRLSVPLLKLRPRKDLVETLLHEMIHAYLFVTHNNRDRDGHGPEFHKHMYRINKEAGTNITVYHSFRDEVKLYQQHWWRCDGPCQKRPPYFGMVKRAMNRPPGPNDFWWNDHERNCGGCYTKVKEPAGFSEKKAKQGNKNSSQGLSSKTGDIRNFFVPGKKDNDRMKSESVVSIKGTKINNVVGLNDVCASDSVNVKNKINHIVGMKDLNATNYVNKSKPSDVNRAATSGNARKDGKIGGGLSANKGSGTLVITSKGNNKEHTCTNKFPSNFVPFSGKAYKLGTSNTESKTFTTNVINTVHHTNESGISLKRHTSVTTQDVNAKRSKNNVTDEAASSQEEHRTVKCPVCGIKVNEININNHLDSCMGFAGDKDVIVCTNDLKSDSYSTKRASDNKVSSENDLRMDWESSSCTTQSESDIIKCPACNKNILQCELNSHLDICLQSIFGEKMVNEVEKNEKYTIDEDVEYPCPCCATLQKHSEMNSHLDQCLISA